MKLQQLKYLLAIADNNLNITHAAQTVHTSQPGISKQLRLLEEELSIRIFKRNGKQLVGITPLGAEIISRARTILQEVDNIKRLSSERDATSSQITLSLATTQTQSKYVLPTVFAQFQKKYQNLRIDLEQGSTTQIIEMLSKDKVVFAILSGDLNLPSDIIKIPCYQWERLVIFPVDHPLGELTKITLKDIIQYPLITYNINSQQHSSLLEAARKEKLIPNIVFTTHDADVIKTYVRNGLGVGIIASMAFEPKIDKDLISYSAGAYLPRCTTWLTFKKGAFLATYMKDFIQTFAPHITHDELNAYLNAEVMDDETEPQQQPDELLPMHQTWHI